MSPKRSYILGIASILLLATALVGGRVAAVGIWASVIVGIFAARSGSKWWLVLPVGTYVVVYALAIFRNDPSWNAGGMMGW